MTWEQLRALLSLRWQLAVNQFHRRRVLHTILFNLIFMALILGVMLSFGAGLIGAWLLSGKATPDTMMFAWDIAIGAFLVCWGVGLLTDVQRIEMIAIDKLLHLPISLHGAFTLNFLGSLLSLTNLMFFPAMIGASFGAIVACGPRMFPLIMLVVGFVFLMASLAYWFRGWLATLMINKRRRRAIVTMITTSIIVLSQLPSLFSILVARYHKPQANNSAQPYTNEIARITADFNAGKIQPAEYTRRSLELQKQMEEALVRDAERRKSTGLTIIRTANLVIPPGWLAYGAGESLRGELILPMSGAVAFALLGSLGLWRSYRSTVRFYLGQYTSQQRLPSKPASATTPQKRHLLEWKVRGFSEPCVAIALASFRTLHRSPEVKSALVGGLMAICIIGGSFLSMSNANVPTMWRPLIAFGVIGFINFLLVTLVQNQFGIDRNGFRAYVLSGVSRRDILLGKNLGLAPFSLGAGTLALSIMQYFVPLETFDILALICQYFSTFLILCCLGNVASILVPWSVAQGSFKPAHLNGVTLISSMLFVLAFPVSLTLLLIPLGLSFSWQFAGMSTWVPVYLVFATLELMIVAAVYWQLLKVQAKMLESREVRILELVTEKTS